MDNLFIKSFLCGPSDKFDIIKKTIQYGAHVAHFDIEDSIPLRNKQKVRRSIITQLLQKPNVLTAVRINAINTKEGLEDIMAFIHNKITPDIIIIPKVEYLDQVKLISDILRDQSGKIKIFCIIESIKGIRTLDRISHYKDHIDGLIFGAADFSKDINKIPGTLNLSYVKSQIVMAAHEIGAMAVDSPCFNIKNSNILKDELTEAVKLGFHAKIAIHPCQISLINQMMNPSEEEIDFARQIIAKMEPHKKETGIVSIQGTMIGMPFLNIAKAIIRSKNEL